jgi:predicted TIM-barrel fold metal-dependent hydrolase
MPLRWANSADSHILEPDDLWTANLPEALAQRAPRSEQRGEHEITIVDGQLVRRDPIAFLGARPPGAHNAKDRLVDLDEQGVWAEAVFPSIAMWTAMINDPDLVRACCRVYNDWVFGELLDTSPRFVPAAMLSMVDTGDAVTELQRTREMGFAAMFLATTPPPGRDFNDEVWDPLWAAACEAGVVLCFHVGTGGVQKVARGPGGAIINYVETFFPAQRTVTHLVAGGALDRYPALRVFIAEAGASWVPALADRMDEAYRQHQRFVRPLLSVLPSELIYRQVYTSFQHDRTAVQVVTGMGYEHVMWGTDYPHLEGTYPDTQRVLAELFDDVPDSVRELITLAVFSDLFGTSLPEAVPAGPGEGTPV